MKFVLLCIMSFLSFQSGRAPVKADSLISKLKGFKAERAWFTSDPTAFTLHLSSSGGSQALKAKLAGLKPSYVEPYTHAPVYLEAVPSRHLTLSASVGPSWDQPSILAFRTFARFGTPLTLDLTRVLYGAELVDIIPQSSTGSPAVTISFRLTTRVSEALRALHDEPAFKEGPPSEAGTSFFLQTKHWRMVIWVAPDSPTLDIMFLTLPLDSGSTSSVVG